MPKIKKHLFIHYTTVKHLYPTSEEQTIKIIPREYVLNISLTLRDDSTNDVKTIVPLDVQKVQNYLEITNVFELVEGRFYDLKVFNETSDIIYRDKIFCTAQNTNQVNNEQYTVNKDAYKSLDSDNDFIIL